jgi:two-component system sensor histidine kinase YesM
MLDRLFGKSITQRLVRHSVLIIVSLGVLGMTVTAIMQSGYNHIVYGKTADVLRMSSAVIENELRRLSMLTFAVASDETIQELLATIRHSPSSLARARAQQEISSALIGYDPRQWHVTSLRIIDTKQSEYIAGRDPYDLTESGLNQITAQSALAAGGHAYIRPGRVNHDLVIVRQIREIETFTLEPLGVVALFVNIPQLINKFDTIIPEYELSISVWDGTQPVDAADTAQDVGPVIARIQDSGAGGYFVTRLAGRRHFVSFARSRTTEWTYVSTVPYDRLYRRLAYVRAVSVLVFLAIVVGVTVLAVRFSAKIARPIRLLSSRIRLVETGNFDIRLEAGELDNPSEEIETVCRDFNLAIRRIRELVVEGYQKRLQLQEANYRILQSQINPHFLYNTLDSVNWQAKLEGSHEIARMVKALGTLMRRALTATDRLIPVHDELALLSHYVTIQRMRYKDRLTVRTEATPEASDCLIPPFTLQPIVENSIRFAVEEGGGTVVVRIEIAVQDGEVNCTVYDDGPGFPRSLLVRFNAGTWIAPQGRGIGLANIRDRIKTTYGPGYGLSIANGASGDGGGAIVRLTFPVRGASGKEAQNDSGVTGRR